MPNGITVGVGGASKQVSAISVGIDGTPKNINEVYAGVNGVPKLVWSAVTGNRLFGTSSSNQPFMCCEINIDSLVVIKTFEQNPYYETLGGMKNKLFAIPFNSNIQYEVNQNTFSVIKSYTTTLCGGIGGTSDGLCFSNRDTANPVFSTINPTTFQTIKSIQFGGATAFIGFDGMSAPIMFVQYFSQRVDWYYVSKYDITGNNIIKLEDISAMKSPSYIGCGGTDNKLFSLNWPSRRPSEVSSGNFSVLKLGPPTSLLKLNALGGTK